MKDKICMICKTAIDTDKEYAEFKHYKKKDLIMSKAYYHIVCFSDRLKGTEEVKKLYQRSNWILSKAEGLLGKNEEVKEIRI